MRTSGPQGLTFWCHNVQKSVPSYLSLLAQWGSDGPDVVLIQEPPWVRVGSARSMTSPQGEPIFGTPTLSGFNLFLPDPSTWSASSATERPRALLLVHKRWNSLSVVYQQQYSSTRDIVTVMLKCRWTDGQQCPLYITSAYNAAPSESRTADSVLRGYTIPPDAHWTIGGDFNRHHPDWSARMPAGSQGRATEPLRDLIQSRSLTILNDSEVAMRRSPEGGTDTVLDLVLVSPSLGDLNLNRDFEVSF